jgi:hypothetical protein
MWNARCAMAIILGAVCSSRAEALVLCAPKDGDGCVPQRMTFWLGFLPLPSLPLIHFLRLLLLDKNARHLINVTRRVRLPGSSPLYSLRLQSHQILIDTFFDL